MGRPYNTSVIRGFMEQIQDQVPDACVGFDIMVGFPGEDDSSFIKTKSLIEDLNPAYLHVFPFSPRPGTAAAGFKPRVPEKIKGERVDELRSLSAKLRLNFYERFLGRRLCVAPESQSADGWTMVRTDNYIPVRTRLPSHFRDRVEFDVIIEKVESRQSLGKSSGPHGIVIARAMPRSNLLSHATEWSQSLPFSCYMRYLLSNVIGAKQYSSDLRGHCAGWFSEAVSYDRRKLRQSLR